MTKNYIITSISLTPKEKEFLEFMECSPTDLMKQKIAEMMENSTSWRAIRNSLEQKIAAQNALIQKLFDFIDTKQLFTEWTTYDKMA